MSKKASILCYKLNKRVLKKLFSTSCFELIHIKTSSDFLKACHNMPYALVLINYCEKLTDFVFQLTKNFKNTHFICINVPENKISAFRQHGAFAALPPSFNRLSLEELIYFSLDKSKKIS